jgi:hypothetical protein
MAMPVVLAQEFGVRYPAGSIRDEVHAQAVLKEADAEMTRITREAKARDAECLRGFFVNSCREDVRREKELAEREVRRVRVEARDVRRRIEAERVAKRRADEQASRAAEDAQRPQKESRTLGAAKAREAGAKQRDTRADRTEASQQGGPAEGGEPGSAHRAPPRMTAEERAENLRKYQQKQEQAQKRAQEQEAKRIANEQRRAEKRKQIEAQEAAREEIRKKAAESIK